MLKIRLSRIGKTNKPMYRIIISENARDPYGRALEILGSYNPYTKEINAEKERIEHWISVGAQLSPTLNNLLVGKDIIKGKKVKAFKFGKNTAEEKNTATAATAEKKAEEKTEEAAKTEEK